MFKANFNLFYLFVSNLNTNIMFIRWTYNLYNQMFVVKIILKKYLEIIYK